MKTLFYFKLITAVVIITGCSKENEINLNNFDVEAEVLNIKAGENVNFNISGDPAQLYFYSGEPGFDYNYHNEIRVDAVQQLDLSFDNHNETADLAPLTVQLSTDFSGVYDHNNISQATWTDITSRFVMSPQVVWPGNWKPSGVVNIADLAPRGKPFYIAFKYLAPAIPNGSTPIRRRRVTAPKLVTTTQLGSVSEMANFTSFQWNLVKKNPSQTSQSQITASSLVFYINNGSREELEEWAISKPLVYTEQEVGFDKSIVLKNYADMPVSRYSYKFQKAGIYQVTFVASNTTIFNNDKVTRSLTVTVDP